MADRPARVGPYDLLEPLGQGGGGTVYRARHRDSGQLAALKTVRLPHSSLLHSIRREIHALARLKHPQVVRIFDEGIHDGLPWYAMELVEGSTLKRYFAPLADATPSVSTWWTHSLDAAAGAQALGQPPSMASPTQGQAHRADRVPRGPRLGPFAPQAHALTLIHRLCRPLAFLHGEGIVHRDLKPDNILVRFDATPVIVDFGLVSHFGGPLGRENLEIAGQMTGTVSYMSPEQIRGDTVDARSDLYSLGCILYELLAGRLPFTDSDPRMILSQHLEQEPLPPSHFASGLDPRLDALVLQLLAKQPRSRLGYADDVATRLVELGAEPSTAGPEVPEPRTYLYRPGFTGRTEQLEVLEHHLLGLDEGRGALFLVGGESGVGKTRLLVEISRIARRYGARVLAGECPPPAAQEAGTLVGGVPLQAFRKALQSIADRCRERGPLEVDRLLGRRGKVLALYEPAFASLPGLEAYPEPAEIPADAARIRLFSYVAETLVALCGEDRFQAEPHVLLLDDLQWADALSLEFLEFLLNGEHLLHIPLVVVGTYRLEEVGPSLRKLLGSPHVQALDLGRLDEQEVSSVVGDMLALSPAPPRFSRFLAQHSEGNPFFVAEYLRAAVGERILYRDEQGSWHVTEDTSPAPGQGLYDQLPLPHALRDLVGRRLDALSPEARSIAQAASVLGRESSSELLARHLEMDSLQRLEAMTELLARQVLEEPQPGRWRFVHDKLREVAYEQIDVPRRSVLHRSAAEALEAVPESDRRELLPELGRHWELAGEPGRARAHYLKAARDITARFDLARAESLYQAYLRLTKTIDSEVVEAVEELGWWILRQAGRGAEARAQLEHALTYALEIGDTAKHKSISLRLASHLKAIGSSKESATLYEALEKRALETHDLALQAQVIIGLATLDTDRGDLPRAEERLHEGLVIARDIGDDRILMLALNLLGYNLQVQARFEDALSYLEQALSIARDRRDWAYEPGILINLGIANAALSRLNVALDWLERALALALQTGSRLNEIYAHVNLGSTLHTHFGDLERARRHYLQAISQCRSIGLDEWLGFALVNEAQLERQLGEDLTLINSRLEESEGIFARSEMTRWQGLCAVQLGHVLLALGQTARPCLDRARSLDQQFAGSPSTGLRMRVAELQRAVEAFEEGRPLFRGQCIEDYPLSIRRWLVEHGHLSAAEAHLDEAV